MRNLKSAELPARVTLRVGLARGGGAAGSRARERARAGCGGAGWRPAAPAGGRRGRGNGAHFCAGEWPSPASLLGLFG